MGGSFKSLSVKLEDSAGEVMVIDWCAYLAAVVKLCALCEQSIKLSCLLVLGWLGMEDSPDKEVANENNQDVCILLRNRKYIVI